MSVRETPIFIRKKGLKMKKKLLLLALTPLMFGSLTGCNNTKADFKVGIIQWVTHPALDKATKGFKQGLREALRSVNKTVDIEFKDAADDPSAASAIVNTFVNKNKDLIMANATPALQVAANSTATIPVVGTSVTSYEVAFDGTIPPHVTGTSDLAPLNQQAQEILTWYPDITSVGIFYCASEANSKYQADNIEADLKALKPELSTSQITFTDSNDINSILNGCVNNYDLIYIPTDNTCAKSGELIHSICSLANKPVFAGEEGICAECGFATLTIDYYKLGQITGEMAAQILMGTQPGELPIRYDQDVRKLYNADIVAELGITAIPEGYTPIS